MFLRQLVHEFIGSDFQARHQCLVVSGDLHLFVDLGPDSFFNGIEMESSLQKRNQVV